MGLCANDAALNCIENASMAKMLNISWMDGLAGRIDAVRHRHVHVHRCRHVAVDVNFSGKTKRQALRSPDRMRVAHQRVAVEPLIWVEGIRGGGVRLEEQVLITDDGAASPRAPFRCTRSG